MVRAGRSPGPLDVLKDAARWLRSLPPVTRTYGVLVLLTALLVTHLRHVDEQLLQLSWKRVLDDKEVWRLVTNLFVVAKPSLLLLVHMLWLLFFMAPLERGRFKGDPGGFLIVLLVLGTLLNVASLFLELAFNGQPLILACVYVWSKYFPNETFSCFGAARVEAFYAPFYCLFINILLSGTLVPDVTAMAAGHAYYLLQQTYPGMLQTPSWLRRAGSRTRR